MKSLHFICNMPIFFEEWSFWNSLQDLKSHFEDKITWNREILLFFSHNRRVEVLLPLFLFWSYIRRNTFNL